MYLLPFDLEVVPCVSCKFSPSMKIFAVIPSSSFGNTNDTLGEARDLGLDLDLGSRRPLYVVLRGDGIIPSLKTAGASVNRLRRTVPEFWIYERYLLCDWLASSNPQQTALMCTASLSRNLEQFVWLASG